MTLFLSAADSEAHEFWDSDGNMGSIRRSADDDSLLFTQRVLLLQVLLLGWLGVADQASRTQHYPTIRRRRTNDFDRKDGVRGFDWSRDQGERTHASPNRRGNRSRLDDHLAGSRNGKAVFDCRRYQGMERSPHSISYAIRRPKRQASRHSCAALLKTTASVTVRNTLTLTFAQ